MYSALEERRLRLYCQSSSKEVFSNTYNIVSITEMRKRIASKLHSAHSNINCYIARSPVYPPCSLKLTKKGKIEHHRYHLCGSPNTQKSNRISLF